MRTTTVMATFKIAETKVAKELRSARGPSTKNTIAPPPLSCRDRMPMLRSICRWSTGSALL
jgi:hypothetical protein